ncbi:MAG: Zn-dependent hydrolase [Vicinamibacterales bacterium]
MGAGPTRREWLVATGATLLGASVRGRAQPSSGPVVDGARLRHRLEQLSRFGRPAGGSFASGVSRVAYSDADLAARAWFLDEVRAAGLTPRVDAAGNVFVRLGDGSGPPILFGSHIDSVPSGGNFDGDLGTLAGLEVLQAVRAAGAAIRHPLELVLWAHEESTAFGKGTACSRIVAGDLKAGDLDQTWNGLRRADALLRIGGDPARIETAVRPRGAWHAYVELHIEQGGTLERAAVPIGIVEGIVAIHRYDVVVEGMANHAGTTPMDGRQDALVAASRLVLAVRRIAAERQGRQVGTVGRLEVEPNSPNVVPGRVTLSIEFRDLSADVLDALGAEARREAAAIAAETGTAITLTLATTNPPAPAEPGVQQAIGRAAERLGLATRRLPSGAGHDAQMIAALCPMGMIFVPSIAGISHSPRERTSWDDCTRGAQTLLATVLDLDRRDSV